MKFNLLDGGLLLFIFMCLALLADAAIIYCLFHIGELITHASWEWATFTAAIWLRAVLFLFNIPFGIGAMIRRFIDRHERVSHLRSIMKEGDNDATEVRGNDATGSDANK